MISRRSLVWWRLRRENPKALNFLPLPLSATWQDNEMKEWCDTLIRSYMQWQNQKEIKDKYRTVFPPLTMKKKPFCQLQEVVPIRPKCLLWWQWVTPLLEKAAGINSQMFSIPGKEDFVVSYLHEDSSEKQVPPVSVERICNAVVGIRTGMFEFLIQYMISDGRPLKFPPLFPDDWEVQDVCRGTCRGCTA